MLPTSVHGTVVTSFNDTVQMKLLRPGQWLEFKTQSH
jgi:hypothetical protein